MPNLSQIRYLLPVGGILLFMLLYVVATQYYPGGSQFNSTSIGFSWIHNYWCNLLNTTAINGEPNPAQPIAIVALFILCGAISYFWYLYAQSVQHNKLSPLIQSAGIGAMGITLFLFTDINHDLITNSASCFGSIATLITIFTLYKSKQQILFYFGLLNIVVVILNNFMYYTPILIVYLPMVQKISFLIFLSWISAICLYMHKTTIQN